MNMRRSFKMGGWSLALSTHALPASRRPFTILLLSLYNTVRGVLLPGIKSVIHLFICNCSYYSCRLSVQSLKDTCHMDGSPGAALLF